jgi:succinyl-CoA synthetase beta subunit
MTLTHEHKFLLHLYYCARAFSLSSRLVLALVVDRSSMIIIFLLSQHGDGEVEEQEDEEKEKENGAERREMLRIHLVTRNHFQELTSRVNEASFSLSLSLSLSFSFLFFQTFLRLLTNDFY